MRTQTEMAFKKPSGLPPEPPSYGHQIEARFVLFHKTNPKVWETYLRIAERERETNPEHGQEDMIYAAVRRSRAVSDLDGTPIKLSNTWKPYYARLYNLYSGYEYFKVRKMPNYGKPPRDNVAVSPDHIIPETNDSGIYERLRKLIQPEWEER